ncbi:hypothetical protein K9L97_00495 [Candidatus Woesearchaeota archaeon]|nr:hypothetical protein [Candidatus Woesearchaeota archaeon]
MTYATLNSILEEIPSRTIEKINITYKNRYWYDITFPFRFIRDSFDFVNSPETHILWRVKLELMNGKDIEKNYLYTNKFYKNGKGFNYRIAAEGFAEEVAKEISQLKLPVTISIQGREMKEYFARMKYLESLGG